MHPLCMWRLEIYNFISYERFYKRQNYAMFRLVWNYLLRFQHSVETLLIMTSDLMHLNISKYSHQLAFVSWKILSFIIYYFLGVCFSFGNLPQKYPSTQVVNCMQNVFFQENKCRVRTLVKCGYLFRQCYGAMRSVGVFFYFFDSEQSYFHHCYEW